MPLVCNIINDINGPSGKGTSIPKVGRLCDFSLVVCVCVFSLRSESDCNQAAQSVH